MSKTLGVCGGEACIKKRRLRVLMLVSFRRLDINESKLLDKYPTLKATDLANAWAYATAFSNEIEIDTRENHED
ncbi:DUF433 domain-containing protein [Microcoleus sp. B4-C5]|uniref:DUF433 domain-containing protein n=1 Tax=unclassified Microcoleus TaxID=2642155 RepID=UPI002FCF15A0